MANVNSRAKTLFVPGETFHIHELVITIPPIFNRQTVNHTILLVSRQVLKYGPYVILINLLRLTDHLLNVLRLVDHLLGSLPRSLTTS